MSSSPSSSSHVSNIFKCIKYKICSHFGNRLVFLLVIPGNVSKYRLLLLHRKTK